MEAKFYISWAIMILIVVCFSVLFIKLTDKSDYLKERVHIKKALNLIFTSLIMLICGVIEIGWQNQTNIFAERKKAIFDEKIVVYRDFLSELDTILHDKQINKNEEYELQIKLSYLSLHINEPENMMIISKAISDIIYKIKNEHNEDKGIMIELMEITDVMYKELYGEEIKTQSKNQTLADMRDEMVLDFYSINVPPEDITSYLYIIKRIRAIKKIITTQKEVNKEKVVYDKQWVYNGYTLVHDLYTDWDKKTGQYVCNERPHKYAVDLKFNTKGDSVAIELFSRKNSKEETNILLSKLQNMTLKPTYFENYYKDSINSIQENGHYTYAKWETKKMDNETLAKEIVDLLNAIDKCREKN